MLQYKELDLNAIWYIKELQYIQFIVHKNNEWTNYFREILLLIGSDVKQKIL